MYRHDDLGKLLKERLALSFPVRQEDIGPDAKLSKKGMTFTTESFSVEGLGHLCVLRMNAMFGLMKMETVVLSFMEKDLPLLNLDWVSAFGKETQIVELYDTQLEPWPQAAQDELRAILERDGDLTDYSAGGKHWYDEILYPCSYHKTGKGISQRLNAAARDYVEAFVRQAEKAPDCDGEAKREKTRVFAQTLLDQGGPAVDQVTKLFGRETAGRLILKHMYGV